MMPGTSAPQSFSRRACLADFFDEHDDIPSLQTHNHHYSHNDNVVLAKKQQEFGHRKRIKP